MKDKRAVKDRGFYLGGRIGSGLGLLLAALGTAAMFLRSAQGQGWSSHHWMALCIAGPIFAAGGWLAGRFAGSYVGDLLGGSRREKGGFLLGALCGALLGESLAIFSSAPALRSSGWVIGAFVGTGIGRELARPRS